MTTSFKTATQSHPCWRKNFQTKPLFSPIYADFETDIEFIISSIGNQSTIIFKQNSVCNGYYIVSEMDDVLKCGYYESPLGFDFVHWFVDEVIRLGNKMAFNLKT